MINRGYLGLPTDYCHDDNLYFNRFLFIFVEQCNTFQLPARQPTSQQWFIQSRCVVCELILFPTILCVLFRDPTYIYIVFYEVCQCNCQLAGYVWFRSPIQIHGTFPNFEIRKIHDNHKWNRQFFLLKSINNLIASPRSVCGGTA